MKVSKLLVTFLIVAISAQISKTNLLNVEIGVETLAQTERTALPAVDFDVQLAASTQKQAFTSQTVQAAADIMAKEAYTVEQTLKVDTYTMATALFNSQKYFGDMCDRCKKIEYFAFKIGKGYLTAGSDSLTIQTSSSPTNSQLFIGEQQIDGTWAFKSLSQGKYIRASNDGTTINWQSFVGPWERWYIERHGNHVHIQSAQFQYHYWIGSGAVLKQMNGGASMFLVQHWPKINWLWNW